MLKTIQNKFFEQPPSTSRLVKTIASVTVEWRLKIINSQQLQLLSSKNAVRLQRPLPRHRCFNESVSISQNEMAIKDTS